MLAEVEDAVRSINKAEYDALVVTWESAIFWWILAVRSERPCSQLIGGHRCYCLKVLPTPRLRVAASPDLAGSMHA